MKIIFLRGLPGTGKTIIAQSLKNNLFDTEIIHVDNFKLKAMQKGKNFKNANNFAYEETIKKLYKFYFMKKRFVIVDELICERKFFNKLCSFLNKTDSYAYWFRILRKLKFILEVETNRNRNIKNTLKDFKNLRIKLKTLKIPNEILIKNDNLDLTTKKILDFLR